VSVTEAGRAAYRELADRIEASVRACGIGGAPPAAAASSAFGADDGMTFGQWLEFVLVPRLRAVAGGAEDPPAHSEVAARAAKELDGVPDSDPLLEALAELDSLVNNR
jgi:uncharacterized protein YqcC (DUF446 family)